MADLPPPLVKPYTRRSADTEQAFLIALAQLGTVRAAAGAIGRSLSTCHTRRRRRAGFAAKWDAVVAGQQRDWRKRVGTDAHAQTAGREPRFDGWTVTRRRAFLRALSETGEAAAACRRVKVSRTAAYALRERSAEFARDWDAALERSAPILEQVAWERAVEGWDEPVIVAGKQVGVRRRSSEGGLNLLLQRLPVGEDGAPRPLADDLILPKGLSRKGDRIVFDEITQEELTASILRKLAAIERHARRESEAGGAEAGGAG